MDDAYAAPVLSGLVIAIDGPSGSGKSTVARAVASRLGLAYLDTGAMYRALTWWVLDRGLDLADADLVAQAARDLPVQMGTDPSAPSVAVGGVDVTEAIRETRISEAVSVAATNLAVRAEMVRRQRQIVSEGGWVAEGRDITTVVAPDADVRVLLLARESERLARRARDVHGAADEASVAATRDQVVRRDAQDSTVAVFTEAAPGVAVIDSSDLGVEETVDAVLALLPQEAT
jgi:CMP/dCMP kinase